MDLADRIQRLARLPLAGLLAMMVFLAYWQVVRAPHLRANALNQRLAERARLLPRGSLLTRDGQVLATTSEGVRLYPLAESCAHLTGYGGPTGGDSKAGLESTMELALAGVGPYEDRWAELWRGKQRGDDVVLTINSKLQELAWEGLRELRGAAIVLDPRSGAVLALCSSPSYDPNRIREPNVWKKVSRSTDAPLLDRPLQGLYAPGGVFPTVVVAAALETDAVSPEETFTCQGAWAVDGEEIKCWKEEGHGELTALEALAQSCDVIGAQVGERLGANRLQEWLSRLPGPVDSLPLPQAAARWPNLEDGLHPEKTLADVSRGEGGLLVSPLCLALVGCAAGSGGEWPEPYVVAEVKNPRGEVVEERQQSRRHRLMSAGVAAQIAGAWEMSVREGMASAGSLPGVRVAGKTGSATNRQGERHAWFVGFAPAEKPQVAVAVVVEDVGSSGMYAAPIGRELLSTVLAPPAAARAGATARGAAAP